MMGRKGNRNPWISLAVALGVLLGAGLLSLVLFRTAWALSLYITHTTVADFNAGNLYHTGLSWRDDGEVQLLPIGLGQPWDPGNNNGLPPRSGHASAYYNGYIYVIGGESAPYKVERNVYFSRVYTDVLTATMRLSDWVETAALPSSVYPDGVAYHDAVALNGYIYIFGGMDEGGMGTSYFDDVLFAPVHSDGSLGDWQQTTPLPRKLFAMETVALFDRIYVLGGLDNDGQSRREVYVAEPDPNTGEIASFTTTTLLPLPSTGGYFGLAAAVANNRIYIYGGASGTTYPSVSPFVYYSEPLSATGQIDLWTQSAQVMIRNLFASEGIAYEAGLLLAVAGAHNNITFPTGDVLATLLDYDTGETEGWVATIGLAPPRFWHTVVQDADDWLYCVGGSEGGLGYLNDVQIAAPYSTGGGQQRAAHSTLTSPTVYAPHGTFTSPPIDVRPTVWFTSTVVEAFEWNTTITDTSEMTIALSYRYRPLATAPWSDWHGPFPSGQGVKVTTTLDLSQRCAFFQYRAFFTTTVNTQTPFLNLVRVRTPTPPDLVVSHLTITGCGGCPEWVPLDKPVQIEVTLRNDGSGVAVSNNFYAVIFITTTSGYLPSPPDVPLGCEGYPDVPCPLILPIYGADMEEGAILELAATYTFTQPGRHYVVAYVDYNNTSPAPVYDVLELEEMNNHRALFVEVGDKKIYLPMVTKSP